MNVIYYLQYLILRVFCFLINLVPFRSAMAISRKIGLFLYWILKSRREITLQNLRLAYGAEKTEDEVRQIAKEAFENLGMIAVEFIRIPSMCRNPRQYVVFEHADLAFKELEKGKGVVFIVSHFGNWEWMAISSGHIGLPMTAIARPLKNPYVYRQIVEWRGATGLKSISKYGGARNTIKVLAENKVVSILIDQHERQGSLKVPFFGRPAATTTLPAILAVKKGIPVMPIFFYRESTGVSRVVLQKAFPLIQTGDYERDIFENTKQYMQSIEQEIRKRPGTWLWMHRRWK